MSSTFDAMQYALTLLLRYVDPEDEVPTGLLVALSEVVDDLHDHSHQVNDAPNRAVAGMGAQGLWRILREAGIG